MRLVRKPIPIVSCHLCNPDRWEAVGRSVGLYRCESCRVVIEKVLITKGEEDEKETSFEQGYDRAGYY